MALYIPHSIFHLARLLYVRPETFGPYYVRTAQEIKKVFKTCVKDSSSVFRSAGTSKKNKYLESSRGYGICKNFYYIILELTARQKQQRRLY